MLVVENGIQNKGGERVGKITALSPRPIFVKGDTFLRLKKDTNTLKIWKLVKIKHSSNPCDLQRHLLMSSLNADCNVFFFLAAAVRFIRGNWSVFFFYRSRALLQILFVTIQYTPQSNMPTKVPSSEKYSNIMKYKIHTHLQW